MPPKSAQIINFPKIESGERPDLDKLTEEEVKRHKGLPLFTRTEFYAQRESTESHETFDFQGYIQIPGTPPLIVYGDILSRTKLIGGVSVQTIAIPEDVEHFNSPFETKTYSMFISVPRETLNERGLYCTESNIHNIEHYLATITNGYSKGYTDSEKSRIKESSRTQFGFGAGINTTSENPREKVARLHEAAVNYIESSRPLEYLQQYLCTIRTHLKYPNRTNLELLTLIKHNNSLGPVMPKANTKFHFVD